jgi:hypothetical protein
MKKKLLVLLITAIPMLMPSLASAMAIDPWVLFTPCSVGIGGWC